jgi:N-acetyl-gamma-glutamyl-phosphate reductase
MKNLHIAVVGASGYTGGELIRLLLLHPNVKKITAISRTHAGKPVGTIHPDLFWADDLQFATAERIDADVLFLCLPHGKTKTWLSENEVATETIIIDLSADFRDDRKNYVYGLPELNKHELIHAKRVANPGCFATAIQLALLPLAAKQQLNDCIAISATTGSTGAGQALSPTVHFTWRNNNHSAYKVLSHQHETEILKSLQQIQPNLQPDLQFIPQRGAFTRGIVAIVHTATTLTTEAAFIHFKNHYAAHPFVHVSEEPVDLKQVVNTNYCLLNCEVNRGRLVITSIIDNLLKGASGQAIQNMNLVLGIDEKTGLQLKPSAY